MISRDYCETVETFTTGAPAGSQSADALLTSFLLAGERAQADAHLELLICEHARPLIKQIIRGALHGSLYRSQEGGWQADAEDIASGVVLKLLGRLEDLKSSEHGDKGIPSFRDYVAVAAYNACHEYLRQKYPERSRLKNKLRYILTRREGLALWEGKNKAWLCGLAVWRDQKRPTVASNTVRQLCIGDSTQPSPEKSQLDRSQNLVELVEAIWNISGGPLALDDLVGLVAELWGVKDSPPETNDGRWGQANRLERLASSEADPVTRIEQRVQLARVWKEICALPLAQRSALLLGLKDAGGRCLTILFADIRIASLPQIAEALNMPAERLAELWDRIPLDDMRIAAHLGVTRQQVIHQRQSARRRLARRMKEFG